MCMRVVCRCTCIASRHAEVCSSRRRGVLGQYRSCREGDPEEDRREQGSKPPGLKEVDRRERSSKPPGLKEVDRREHSSKPPGLKEVDRRQCSKSPGLKEVDRREHSSTPPGLSKVAARDHTGYNCREPRQGRCRCKQTKAPEGSPSMPVNRKLGERGRRRTWQGTKPSHRYHNRVNGTPLKLYVLQAIRDKIASLEATVQRLSGSASTEALRKELLDHATRPAALFDPRKAISMMEALVDTAKGEGHSDAEQFKLILSQMRRHAAFSQPAFPQATFPQAAFSHHGVQILTVVVVPELVEGGEGAELLAHRTDVLDVMVVAAIDDVMGDDSEGQYSVKPLEAYMQHLATHQGWVTRKRDGANIVSPSIEMVAQGKVKASADSLLFRDPESFRAGGLHKHATEWEKIIETCEGESDVGREMFSKISEADKQGKKVRIEGGVKQELEYWKFLDTWQGHMPWKPERHEVVNLTTDASGYKWAGVVESQEGQIECGDYWTEKETEEHISIKETEALTRTLLSVQDSVKDKRVDARVDNQNLIRAWQNQGAKSLSLNRAIVRLRYWWPILNRQADEAIKVAVSGDRVLRYPVKRQGWKLQPTKWDLWAFRINTARSKGLLESGYQQ
ncbi:Cadherin-like and PC-esterase [Branchiostoma belcheri]|nr:Cadherin-like and PC-esterase [Branchiostoma belcheri]